MSPGFTPFLPPNSKATAADVFRLKIVPQAQGAEPFLAATSHAGLVAKDEGATSSCGNEPKITLQRDGDRITGVQIQCGCGRMIELACIY
jgi:hypothetical protein